VAAFLFKRFREYFGDGKKTFAPFSEAMHSYTN
jgi:hypothetical protein